MKNNPWDNFSKNYNSQVTKSGDKNNPKLLGKLVGEELRSKGINDLALNWREKVEEWNTT